MNNKNGTELTIFQGGPSIHLNNSGQAAEEEEDLQDQERRKKELQKELENAFDDLIEHDEENDTINSTNYSQYSPTNAGHQGNVYTKQNNPKFNGHANGGSGDYKPDFHDRDDVSRLKNLLESKCREIEYISNELITERQKRKQQVDELEKRLAIAEAEKERAIMTREQTHELLVENKAKIIEMEENNIKLKSKIKSLENENSQLIADVESTRLMLSDAQHKYDMVERNAHLNEDRRAEMILKQTQDRHQAKVAMMQQQIDSLKSKLETLEHENKNLDIRYKELQRSRELLLVEKSDVINELNKNLEEAQRQVQELMGKPNMAQEIRRQQNVINTYELQTEEMAKTINNLTQKLQTTSVELEMMDSMVFECSGNNTSFSESNFIQRNQNNLLKNAGSNNSTPMTTDERLKRLKDELYKAINNIKIKREEIKILEKQLSERNQEIKQLKNDENKALVELSRFKEEATRSQSKVKSLENELEQMKIQYKQEMSLANGKNSSERYEEKVLALEAKNNEMESTLEQLQREFEQLNMKYNVILDEESEKGQKMKAMQMEVDQLRLKYQQATSENEILLKRIHEVRSGSESNVADRNKVLELERALNLNQLKCEELVKQLEKEKLEKQKQLNDIKEKINSSMQHQQDDDKQSKNISNNCVKCKDYVTEITKLEINCLQLQNTNADYLKEITEMKIELDDLNDKLNLKESRDQEIDKLKKKAQEFEEYMKSHPRSGSYSSSAKSSSPQSVNNTNSTMKTDVSTATSPSRKQCKDQCCSTSPELVDDDMKEKVKFESRVRDEMAKLFAAEIKNAEIKFREENEKIQEEIRLMSDELDQKSRDLHVRTQEVEVLKFTILKEREKFEEILSTKNGDFKNFVEKQNETIMKYKTEYEKCLDIIDKMKNDMNEKTKKLIDEREKIDKILQEVSEERMNLAKREDDMVQRIKKLQEESNNVVEQLNQKYLSAKKTALTYKQYSEDKEKHMLKEYDRIKDGYSDALAKVQSNMKEVLENQEKLVKEKIKKMENEYEFKIDLLKTELEEVKRKFMMES